MNTQIVLLITTAHPVEVSKILRRTSTTRKIHKFYGLVDSSLTYLSFCLTEEATPLSTTSLSASPLKFANSFVNDIFERIAAEASPLYATKASSSQRCLDAGYNNLNRLGIQSPNTKVLLGGGAFDPDTQHEIRKVVEHFLSSSGTIDLI